MNKSSLPQHVAIIMDGNGRWAKKRFLPRVAGHKAGVESARRIVRNCAKHKIKVLSLFAFSSENWRRPAQEVSYLMELFLTGLEREVGMLHENNVRLRFIGDRSKFNEKLCSKITEVEHLTAANTGMTLIIAADYGGQWDICQAVRELARSVEAGTLSSQDITPELIRRNLSFADLPDPDLFIRTSGELRISNFMLWQLAYSELYFTETLWPDFDEAELEKALSHYAERERRFGYSSDQLNELAG
ncbi:Ditrans,polycis-undecaprenyl-diphosphate synthase ((2E,6E)-farnesyl-diphosphate specific) [Aquicella siphonis]|uniref:Ditrans,polycis-undecaprenyl-diphosphate synthase ((2E,6E)-farnesyl-diphosphate specific) n=1 Tax=Aquicella siphonis TaxID=254247 RepID=A0A5E4PG10_9COXI|nr:isoprenyl transferase [Aquicella siphonis]VVC75323.1 Ditrans,polycis-undecaprenyl-diphosphate synthase ((2E,6E)-farnesyl-diphosphate specific) [Aquicella siphonis]